MTVKPDKPVRIALPENVPVHYLELYGAFFNAVDTDGIDFEPAIFYSPQEQEAGLDDGSMDLARLSIFRVPFHIERGTPIKILGCYGTHSPEKKDAGSFSMLVAKKGSGLKIEDLPGKRIGCHAPNVSTMISFKMILHEAYGIDLDSMEWPQVMRSEVLQSLDDGRCDGVVVYEELAHYVGEHPEKYDVVLDIGNEWSKAFGDLTTGVVMSARDDLIKSDREFVNRIMNVIVRSGEFAFDNYPEICHMLHEKMPGISEKASLDIFGQWKVEYRISRKTKEDIMKLYTMAKDVGLIEGEYEIDDIFYDEW